jgi:hypothetical protein
MGRGPGAGGWAVFRLSLLSSFICLRSQVPSPKSLQAKVAKWSAASRAWRLELEREAAALLAFPFLGRIAASRGAAATVLHVRRSSFPTALAISCIARSLARCNALGVLGDNTPLRTARALVAAGGPNAAMSGGSTFLLTGRERRTLLSVPDPLTLLESPKQRGAGERFCMH